MSLNIKYNKNKKKPRCVSCTNCGKPGHEYRDCDVPTTSWGIILVNTNTQIKIDHSLPKSQTESRTSGQSDSKNLIKIYSSLGEYDAYKSVSAIDPMNDFDKYLVSVILESVSFLLISRKHSLAYVEFVRGRYEVEQPMQIAYLFKLMSTKEIDKIKHSLRLEHGFDYLWTDLWGEKSDSSILETNKKDAEKKYTVLKHIGVDGPEIGLEYMVNEVNPKYNIDEWGFPKGRKQKNETDRECAIREFTEESGYSAEDFKIIDEIEPIVEELNGTNGVRYRHIYYVAELLTEKHPVIKSSGYDEVGQISFMNLTTAGQTFRPYHKEKIRLLTALTEYYLDTIYSKFKELIKKSNDVSVLKLETTN